MRTSAVKQRILDYLAARPDEGVFLRSEFKGLSKSRSGVDKALRSLVAEGRLIRMGYGIVARTSNRRNIFTGEVMPELGLLSIASQALRKLGVPFRRDSATRAYNEGLTTQVPAWIALDVGKSRISRVIGYPDCEKGVTYERSNAPVEPETSP